MTEKTLKFNNIRVNKKKFNMSKEPIDFNVSRHRSNSCMWQI